VVIVGLGVALYLPDSRQAILNHAMPVVDPLLAWSAQGEMREIERRVTQYGNTEYRLPARREWIPFLERYFAGDAATDPWDQMYQFHTWRDSFAIISYGPDRERGTTDDIRVTKAIQR
jgi:hypothetical protein